ncbi:MAG: hypothetical protein ACE5KZ_09715 [Candidatus Scalinduaceae bacterium]
MEKLLYPWIENRAVDRTVKYERGKWGKNTPKFVVERFEKNNYLLFVLQLQKVFSRLFIVFD